MKIFAVSVALYFAFCVNSTACASDASQTAQKMSVANPIRLADVRSVYVAPLGAGEGAEVVRQKIINRLVKGGVILVAETADDADATLIGASSVNTRHYLSASYSNGFGSADAGTRFSASTVVRLINRKSQILWAGEASSMNLWFGHDANRATSNAADKTVKALTKAIEKARQQIAATSLPN